LVKLGQPRQRGIENGHVGAHADCDLRGVVPGDVWFIASWVTWDDHYPAERFAFVPAVSFGLFLALSCVAALGFGWRVGRDWYRTGR